MNDDQRHGRDVPHAAAWDATAGSPVGPTAPVTPQQQFGAAAGGQQQQQQQPSEGVEYRPPAATPKVDVVESEDEVVVLVDAPGFAEDQLTVHADASNLYVTADRSEDSVVDADAGERALLRERPVRLERAIALPSHVDPEEATAEHDDGVCRITVPKDDDDRRHEIAFQ